MFLGERSRLGRDLFARRSLVVVAGLYMFLGLMATPALAHAERIASRPEANEELSKAPAELSIDFTEPPTGDANLVVMDGCENDVVREITVQNMSVSASLAEGQPGKWVVRSTVVSGVDGHQTKDSWSFSVEGQKDCSQGNDEPTKAEGNEDDGESSLPIVPIAIGTLAVAGIALLLRRITGGSDN